MPTEAEEDWIRAVNRAPTAMPSRGIGESGHQVHKGLGVTQRHHGGAHHLHADKQHAETGHDLADVVGPGHLDKDHHGHADESEERGKGAHVQSNQLSGDSGADIGAHDDPDRLVQGHHPGIDEAHHHDCGGGGGLDHGGDDGAYQYTLDPVGGQFLQDLLHLVS